MKSQVVGMDRCRLPGRGAVGKLGEEEEESEMEQRNKID